MEKSPAVPPALRNADTLVPHLKKCGYGDAQIERPFKVDQITIPVVAFAGRPFDSWSACIAVVNLNGESKATAANVRALGAATVFVCGPRNVDWWAMGPDGPTASRSIEWPDLASVFRDHKEDLAPSRIYNAKLQRPAASARQLWFFDAGLMPAVERNRGQTLLRLVENAIGGLQTELGSKLNTRPAQEDAYRTVFWLLAAKVLHDKRANNFIRIDLKNVDEVFDRIGRHHGETNRFPPFGREGRRAIDEVAAVIARCGSLADVSSESIAYVYENALIDKTAGGKKAEKGKRPYDIRKELGIHSTPSVLIHHMLSRMWGMIEEIPSENRDVFEPACGHAPFLTGAMRWLRDWGQGNQTAATHDYLRSHLHGLEADDFARELAKLGLTLADEPYGNSWAIASGDMFLPGVLAKHTKKAHILLSNPPYEAFSPAQRTRYAKEGEAVTANTKSTEMLLRTLPYLPPGGVFGAVMPQGVLHDKQSKLVREQLLYDFDLSEISTFADNLFEHGDHEVAVLIGRRKKARAKAVSLHYRRVRESGMKAFKESLAFSSDRVVAQNWFTENANSTLLMPDLVEVWSYLRELTTLGSVAEIQKGFEFLNEDSLKGREINSEKRKSGWIRAIMRVTDDYNISDLPKTAWIDPSPENFRRLGAATKLGIPQVVLNYAPVAREPWRLKAVIDHDGLAVSSRFLVFREKTGGPSLRVLWALLNSPVANAYAYCFSGKRETLVKEWRAFPVPQALLERTQAIEAAASAYIAALEASESEFMQLSTKNEVKQALLELDAVVLKLYDLPPHLERQLLDLFAGVERKGVGCDFRGYYPPGFTSYLPLDMIISSRFQRAAADETADRFNPGESAHVRDALNVAAARSGEK